MRAAAVPRGDVEVLPAGPVAGTLAAPASKSVTNRLLVIAALADSASVLADPLVSDDSERMRELIEALGARTTARDGEWEIAGTGGRLAVPLRPLDAGLSGTTMRFGMALAALAPGTVTLTGGPPLLARPVGPLAAALRALGAGVSDEGGYPPVTLEGGGLEGGAVTVEVSGSSQFASAVLLVAPYAATDVEVATSGKAASDYIDLTVDMMRAWGADVGEAGQGSWRVAAGAGYRGQRVSVEYDASAAAHLLGLAAATGGTVTVSNAVAGSLQPDAGLPEVLERMGCRVTRDGAALTVTGPRRLRAVDVSLERMPDQVTTVATLAALAEGVTEIRDAGVARAHETDRLAALATELGKLGVDVAERPDGLRVVGGGASGPARLRTYDDHRLAMAFAGLAARVPGVAIAEPWCVTKTYPGFWVDVRELGVGWREAKV